MKSICILFLAANPKGTSELRLSEEVRTIDERIRVARFRDQITLQQAWAVRETDLSEVLLRYKPDIVHFSGHGSSTGEILLEDKTGMIQPVSSKALSDLFRILSDNIRCMVLNACFSKIQAEAIAKHIDCVIGMVQTVKDSSAIAFAGGFYRGIGYGRSIKESFELGCNEIDLSNLGEFEIPKLLLKPGTVPSSIYLIEPQDASKSLSKEEIEPQRVSMDTNIIVEDFFQHTEHLILNKLWAYDPSKIQSIDKADKTWVPLSAVISERIPPEFIERKIGGFRGERKISNLNAFIKKTQKDRIPFAITGEPGSGKTFELVKLYSDFRKEFKNTKDWLPILIFINELPPYIFEQIQNENHALRDFIKEYLARTKYPNEVAIYITKNLYRLKIVFLFDALDELPNKENYELAIKVISEQFIKKNQKQHQWRFLLSCRTEDYDTTLDVIEIEIQPLSAEQIEAFFKKKYLPDSKKEKKRMQAWSRLKSNDMLWFQRYISNPYFLAVMLESIEDAALGEKTEPTDLKDLFKKTIKRELSKVEQSELPDDFQRSFEQFCSIISFLLVEKTSLRKNSLFDLSNSEDLEKFFTLCNELASRNTDPFSSLLDYLENKVNRQSENLDAHAIIKLGRLFNENILHGLSVMISDSDRLMDGNAALLTKYQKLLDPFFSNETELPGLIVKFIFDISSDKVNFIFNFACLYMCFFIVEIGTARGLLKTDSHKKFIIKSFRHRRLMEYFAALYLNNNKIVFDKKARNLWYKQTLCLLAAITSDLDWFFKSSNYETESDLFHLVDACYFVPQKHTAAYEKYFMDISTRLEDIAFKSKSSIHSSRALKGIHKFILAGHLNPSNKLAKQIMGSAANVSLYRIGTLILLDLDQKGLLNYKFYISFLIQCLRNICSIKI